MTNSAQKTLEVFETSLDFDAALLQFELICRQLNSKNSPANRAKHAELESLLRENYAELSKAFEQMDSAYQDIAKTYFDFIERVEVQLGMDEKKDVDEDLIIKTIEALQEKALVYRPNAPFMQYYMPGVVDDMTFVIGMKAHQNGQWCRRKDHDYAMEQQHVGADRALKVREEEIARLKAENAELKKQLSRTTQQ